MRSLGDDIWVSLRQLLEEQKDIQQRFQELGIYSDRELIDVLLNGVISKLTQIKKSLNPPFKFSPAHLFSQNRVDKVSLDDVVDALRYMVGLVSVIYPEWDEVWELYKAKGEFLLSYLNFLKRDPQRIFFLDLDGVIYPYHEILLSLFRNKYWDLVEPIEDLLDLSDARAAIKAIKEYLPRSKWDAVKLDYRRNYKFLQRMIDPETPVWIRRIKDLGFEICILSARKFPDGEIRGRERTRRWLKGLDIYFDEIFFLRDKYKILSLLETHQREVVIVDDDYQQIKEIHPAWGSKRVVGILFGSEEKPFPRRARTFREVYDHIESVFGRPGGDDDRGL